MILGTVLVLVTWMILITLMVIIGLAATLGLRRGEERPSINSSAARVSMWWGLAITLIAILLINLWFPLSTPVAGMLFALIVIVAALVVVIHRPRISLPRFSKLNRMFIPLLIALALALLFLAFAALGPVTNYDSGLYHLGAVKYASEYSTVTGLANLYFPFGYNTSLYPFAAFLGNGPWGAEGYRLANGFIVVLAVHELFWRLLAARGNMRRLSAGSWVLLVAMVIGLVPLVALSDYWTTSPSSDAPVMILTFVACAYLVDGVFRKKNMGRDLATAFVIAVILFSLRPTMTVFLIGVVVVIAVTIIKRGSSSTHVNVFTPLLFAGLVGVFMLTVQTIRDYFLSGWFQYPLSIYSFDTAWTTADPSWNRVATLGNARNPADIWGSVDGFAWVSPWVSRLPSQWETFLILALTVAMFFLIIAALVSRLRVRWAALALVLIPSAITTLTWFFFSPPTFRFGWGPVFSLLIIPIGIALHSLARPESSTKKSAQLALASTLILSVGLLLVTGYTALFRLPKLLSPEPAYFTLGSFELEYQVTPVVDVPVQERVLPSGLITTFPTESDQCWDNYPLCTPIVSDNVQPKGDGIQEGFLP
jgi:hypothetical protein